MAEVWEAGSTVRLVFVPWDSSYTDVVAFSTPAEQAAYFDSAACSAPLVMENATYVRPNQPITVEGPYSQVHRYNYCIVDNPVQPVEGSEPERLFYFITQCEYASPKSTRITLQLDVWQTRVVHDGCRFGQAYLERGHAALSQIKYRREVDGWSKGECLRRYCQVPEGMDIGDHYVTAPVSAYSFSNQPYIIILSTADLTADPGTVSAPNLETARGTVVDGLPSGAAAYLLTSYGDFSSAMAWLASHSWVAQCVLGIYYMPSEFVTDLGNQVRLGGVVNAYTNFRSADQGIDFPNPLLSGDAHEYGLPPEADGDYGKLLTYPYCAYEVTAFSGKSLMLKPQLFVSDDAIQGNMTACVLPPFVRVGYFPVGYATTQYQPAPVQHSWVDFQGTHRTGTISKGDYLDTALWLTDMPQFATVNNNYLTYMASTVNSREYQYQSAGWSLAASNASASNSYDLSQMAIATQSANQAISNQLTDKQQIIGLLSGGANVLGNVLSGNVGGAASATFGTALNAISSELSQRADNQTFANNRALASYTADANMRLSEYVNQGNYENAIAGINAKVQDAALTPPSQVGQAGGSGYSVKSGLYTAVLRVKTLNRNAAKPIIEYWQRYGYAVHEWVHMPQIVSDFALMDYATYWKCQDVQVTCATANDTEVQAIKGILTRGVTVYDDPDAIGDFPIAENGCAKRWDLYKEV